MDWENSPPTNTFDEEEVDDDDEEEDAENPVSFSILRDGIRGGVVVLLFDVG